MFAIASIMSSRSCGLASSCGDRCSSYSPYSRRRRQRILRTTRAATTPVSTHAPVASSIAISNGRLSPSTRGAPSVGRCDRRRGLARVAGERRTRPPRGPARPLPGRRCAGRAGGRARDESPRAVAAGGVPARSLSGSARVPGSLVANRALTASPPAASSTISASRAPLIGRRRSRAPRRRPAGTGTRRRWRRHDGR